MNHIITQIEKIKYKVSQKELEKNKIDDLEKLLQSQHVTEEDVMLIQDAILKLKDQSLNNNDRGIKKLKKFRLSSKKTSLINEESQFIYPKLIELAKTGMFFGESGEGKTLLIVSFANYGLINKTIKSVILLDFDNSLVSLKKRKYDQLADKWGDDKFDYLLGSEIVEEMEPINALKELVLDGENNKDKMIVIDSGSHFVYDGTKNERQKLKEFIDVVKVLKNQGASLIIIHHSHRVRDGQVADYHGSFEWKRDLDYQIQITKNEDANTWLFHVKKDRDNLIESKAFKYDEDNVLPIEVSFEESNITRKESIFIKEIQEILKDFGEKVNQTELLKESKAFRQSIVLGDKRSIKWLQSFAEKGMWQYEKVASQNNSIFYCINDKVKNQPNLPNNDMRDH
ncbi:AAA family ATPase [Aliarcobacter cibarius]|uniref:AAA family ATPase n=1 Tax=Aliarcobacter cibarius TaxID=255507 RepID=UPI0010FEF37B|nr:AAA family ATPase [Aliarcobacter cibarius]TLT05037.1 hypothetical protein FE248_02595 [Aliarcobacter cibarius]